MNGSRRWRRHHGKERERPRREVPREVGAPACGIEFASSAKALEGFKVRAQPKEWLPGKFVHPHDACFVRDGNIFVVEWVQTGRVTLLRRVS